MAGAKAGGKSKSSTPAQKERREKSWARGAKTRTARAEEQRKAAERNRELRRKGEPTPWEIACQVRSQRRAEAARRRPGGSS